MMSIRRLLSLKQCFIKPTSLFQYPKSPTKPNSTIRIQTRTYGSTLDCSKPLPTQIVRFVAMSPDSSVVPLLEQFHKEGYDIKRNDLRDVIRKLRRHNHPIRALEVCEWMMSNSLSDWRYGDTALQLTLIGNVHGVDAAERFFHEENVHDEKTYGALLNCYMNANLVDKCLSHFRKMKNDGLARSALPYNNIMSLYINIGQAENVPQMLSEMEGNNVSPDNFSYRACLRSFATRSDFAGMDKVVEKMESQHGLKIEWLTYVAAANHYLEGGYMEKAVDCLQKAEHRVRDNPVGYNTLFTTYTKIGDFNQIMSLWQRRKAACKPPINADYLAIIGSLVKLDKMQEAERLLHEWESSGNFYDFRVPNVLLLGYTQKGLVDKAERILAGIIRRGQTPIPNTWSIISSGHIQCQNMDKALQCMKKALILGAQHKSWFPHREAISSILQWLSENGEITIVDEFLYLLTKVLAMDEEMYRTLLRANFRHGNDVTDILLSMNASNIDVDEETLEMIKSKHCSRC